MHWAGIDIVFSIDQFIFGIDAELRRLRLTTEAIAPVKAT
jgi:hypothetical protein